MTLLEILSAYEGLLKVFAKVVQTWSKLGTPLNVHFVALRVNPHSASIVHPYFDREVEEEIYTLRRHRACQ